MIRVKAENYRENTLFLAKMGEVRIDSLYNRCMKTSILKIDTIFLRNLFLFYLYSLEMFLFVNLKDRSNLFSGIVKTDF